MLRVLEALARALVLLGVVALAARLLRLEVDGLLVLLGGAAEVLLGAAPAALAVALLRRRRVLGLAAVALLVARLALVAAAPQAERPPGPGTPVRVLTHNVLVLNDDVAALAEQVRGLDPDVLALQEVTPAQLAGLRTEGAFARLPHVLESVAGTPEGLVLASRFPLRHARVVASAGRRVPVADVVLPDGTAVRVVAAHVPAPLGRAGLVAWRTGLADLAALAVDAQGPLVLAGDLNANRAHTGFTQLLATGLTDAHAAVGRAGATTWPVLPGLPRLTLVDHVLVDGGVGVRRVTEGRAAGSDHVAVVADLVVPGRAAADDLSTPAPGQPAGP